MEHEIDLFGEVKPVAKKISTKATKVAKEARSGTFTDNMKLPIHRWFRYSAGFSAEWAKTIIEQEKTGSKLTVLDPFAGSGTTLLAAEHAGVESYGLESHPFVARIASAKLLWHKIDPKKYIEEINFLIEKSKEGQSEFPPNTSELLAKCYSDDSLNKLFALKSEFLKRNKDTPTNKLVWLTITAILRACSHAGTAQWQYILPNKTKAKVLDPFNALSAKADQIVQDIEYAKKEYSPLAKIIQLDARLASEIPEKSIDLVVTSPPYPNNYDYADATRLEMTFWGDIKGWSDLHEKVRKHIIRSCSQHSAADRIDLNKFLESELLKPISDEISEVCNELAEVRKTKGGKKTYHTMIAAYFLDIAQIFHRLRPLCKDGSRLCFVVGDSAPYGVYVPAEEWLGKLAIHAGFKSYTFEKIRDRNVKWKNRKHDVPLHEGRLWIEG
ncbi:DNA methyltransferase [Vogesella sp. LYT5W]|uniref:site-specific DNA-methyltransferase (cytosine-N(4)-specific) n=1 Tax=Vogesella margarita TaxID=2984199 RepID=A0ABT5ILJ8_9NEIS|nr:DNA methyltransferase [Vogesella margarita]MDC7713439.1 DNA methyltransferase [Vogesella margarita]